MRSLLLYVTLVSSILSLSQSLSILTSRRTTIRTARVSSTPLGASISSDNSFSSFGLVSWDWEHVASQVFVDDMRPIILFDGKCNLCNGGVNFALDHDEKGKCNLKGLVSSMTICIYSFTYTYLCVTVNQQTHFCCSIVQHSHIPICFSSIKGGTISLDS